MYKKSRVTTFLLLHFALMIYSISFIFSKLASKESFGSIPFTKYYSIVLVILVIYAFLWQQVLKNFKMTTAFANKAIVIIWGIVFGNIIFDEKITINMIIGSVIIFVGILIVVRENE